MEFGWLGEIPNIIVVDFDVSSQKWRQHVSNMTFQLSPHPPVNGASIKGQTHKDNTNSDKWHNVPRKLIKRASIRAITILMNLLLPLAHQCTNINVEH